MGGTGPWVRGMGTWHHPLFTGPPIYFEKNGPGPAHAAWPLGTMGRSCPESLYGEIFGHNRSKSECFQVQPVTYSELSAFLY